jgi:hypothetical protein
MLKRISYVLLLRKNYYLRFITSGSSHQIYNNDLTSNHIFFLAGKTVIPGRVVGGNMPHIVQAVRDSEAICSLAGRLHKQARARCGGIDAGCPMI